MIDMSKRKVNVPGETHSQIIHFDNGDKLLIQDVEYIWEKEMVHIVDIRGIEYVVNKHKVNYYERIAKRTKEENHGKDKGESETSSGSKTGADKQA